MMSIWTWITSAKGMVVIGLVVVMLASIFAIATCADRKAQRAEERTFNAGRTQERVEGQDVVINNVREARDAQEELGNRGSAELERVRSRYDRSHQNRQ
jgi:hypothetical protein